MNVNKNGPVIVIEDDLDDQQLLQEVFSNLKYDNEVIYLHNGEEAYAYLDAMELTPFLILSDINMPRMNGFELRERIHTNEKLHSKCIPYLFFSTSADQQAVIDAYSMSVQGFFLKQTSFIELENSIRIIMEYWKRCVAPNDVRLD
jgi:CheY-like chemotaxis protein